MSNSIGDHTGSLEARPSGDNAVRRITEGLDLLVEEMHPLGNVVQAFRELLVERARFKAELEGCQVSSLRAAPDPLRFERGVPLASIESLIDSIDDTLWAEATERLMPVMVGSFPKIGKELEIIQRSLSQGSLDPRALLKAYVMGNEGRNTAVASRLEVNPQTLAFAVGQVAKPLIERIASHLSPLVEGLFWGKGYCPLCGTMPELAFLQGEGQRWLRCASCSHEWRFTLLICPFCESENHDDFEIYFVAGREYENVDVCHKCRRYVPTIDQRKWPKPIAREVAAIALMHLDVIAQEKGFLPAAVCAWNIVRDRDTFSMPVRITASQ